MQFRIVLFMAIVPVLAWAGAASAQDEPVKRPATDTRPSTGVLTRDAAMYHKSSDIIGTKVKNPQGEDLGKVEELVIDPREGTVEYAVLSFGGFLGMGDKLFALPFSLLKMPGTMPARNADGTPKDPGTERTDGMGSKDRKPAYFVLDVDKERLKKASGFPKNNWPDIHSAAWRTEIDTFYGVPASERGAMGEKKPEAPPTDAGQAIERNREFKIVKVSELMGKNVYNSANDKIGDIKDLVIDHNRGRIHYFVLTTGSFLGLASKQLAVPWEAIKHQKDGDKDKCVVDVTKERLEKAPEYKDSEWARMTDPTWSNDLYAYYGARKYWTETPADAGGKRKYKD
jgi:sporulation protein YlmC with PRC-barrel domain